MCGIVCFFVAAADLYLACIEYPCLLPTCPPDSLHKEEKDLALPPRTPTPLGSRRAGRTSPVVPTAGPIQH